MSEFAPGWTNARMTKAQVRKYVADMKEAQELARQKLEKAKANWELDKDILELERIEKELENL